MAVLLLHVNGWDSGWTGNWANVDDPVSAPDGQVVYTPLTSPPAIFDVTSVTGTISDADVVAGVSLVVRTRAVPDDGTEPAEVDLDAEILIGGISQGTDTVNFLSESFSNENMSDAGWNSDWTEAQLNGMQVRVTARKVGGLGTWTAYIDCIDINVTYYAPILAEPDRLPMVLAGKAPNVLQEGQIVPPAGALVLGSDPAVVDYGIAVATGVLIATGQVAYVAPNLAQIQPNAWDDGWPVGFVANIDEPTGTPDGQYISTSTNNDITFVDFDNPSTIVEADTVLGIAVTVRARGVAASLPEPGEANLDVDLYIEGGSVGPTKTIVDLPTGFVNRTFTDVAWNQDWTPTQLNSLQIRLQSRGSLAEDWYVDGIDVVVEYDPQSPLSASPPVGSLSLASVAPDATHVFFITPAIETLALTEYAPSFLHTSLHHPGPDELRFSTQVPVTLVDHRFEPAREVLTLTGQLPVRLDEGSETPAEDTLVLTGKIPTLGRTANHTFFPPPGALLSFLEVAGTEETGETNRIVQHEQLNFSFLDVPTIDITEHFWRIMPLGTASLTGYAPSLNSYTLVVGAGTLTLTGQTPAESGNSIITVDEATLVFGSVAPQTATDFLQLELLGYAPTLDFGLASTEGALVLQGYALNSLNASRLVPETALTLAGQAPTSDRTTSVIGHPKTVSLTTRYDIEFIATPSDIV